MKRIIIPVKGSDTFNLLKTRGYVSVKNGNLYHNFESFAKWMDTGVVELAWGETVWDLLGRIKDA